MLKTRHLAFDRDSTIARTARAQPATPVSAIAGDIILQAKQTVQTAVREDRFGSILSKRYFWRRREEEHFKNKPALRILIQVWVISDSIIAHFCRWGAHRLTFSTASVIRAPFCGVRDRSAVHPIADISLLW
jgi:hypothetical protein